MNKSDWKIFRKRVPEWRERYLQMKNQEIVAILTDQNRTPTEQFWDAKKMSDAEADVLVECLDGHTKSKMEWYVILLYRHGFIDDEDLREFSGELRQNISRAIEIF